MYMLVTNDSSIENDSYNVLSYDAFMEAAMGDGIDFDDGLLIDVNSVPDVDGYNVLLDAAGEMIQWITFTDEVPEWFSSDLSETPGDLVKSSLDEQSLQELSSAMSLMDFDERDQTDEKGRSVGRVITFGSAKGGSGKTFTSLITAVYYAKDHPNEKVCILDLDIEEPQISIVIKMLRPNIKSFYPHYQIGETSFDKLKECRANNKNFPPNLDFYLTPRDSHPIQDEDFWECVMTNLFYNYDMVILDTGTTYMQTPAIASAYKVADKVIIVSMANLASTVTVSHQIKRLTGEVPNDVYAEEDEIGPKLNLVVTNSYKGDICDHIINKLAEECPIVACFGNLTEKINMIEIISQWDYFDDNAAFRKAVRDIYS